uniref:DNA repair protein RAD51 4 n=1 Tax=Lygus hesperus TaxID=30085 RepID=A0A0A9Z1L7_LYGHE
MSKILEGMLDTRTMESLAKLKIFQVEEFLRADIEKLAIAGLKPEDSMKLKLEFSKLFLPTIVTGDEHYKKQLKNCSIMQTRIPALDELLEGGLRMGTLLEVCGPSGSGKTQLCLNVAVKLAGEYKIDVLYADTKGDLVASHLASLVEELGFQEDFDAVLERIKVAKTVTMHSLISTLHHIQDPPKMQKRIKVIIVDSLASLYFPFIGVRTNDGNEGLSLLNHVASLLKKLAVCHHLVILLVNLGTRWNQEEEFDGDCGDDESKPSNRGEQEDSLKPAMGKYWAHVPNTRLFLVRDQSDSSTRTLIVQKSEYLASGKTSKFVINHNGTIK